MTEHKGHHHILPTGTALAVGGSLLFLTVVTVAVAHVDLGPLNFFVAFVVATVKASLVCLFFMNLFYDRKENGAIFATSFLFLAIFIVLTATDLFFRGSVYHRDPIAAGVAGKARFKKAWEPSPDLVAHGKELYNQQCVSCHGAAGRGDGPAAGSLVPPPRNFTQAAGWKNGRKPSQIFKTLREGLPPSAMASFATLPAEDRWALAHYVGTLGPSVEKDAAGDLAKVGVDPSKEGSGETVAASIPVALAMERMAEPGGRAESAADCAHRAMQASAGADRDEQAAYVQRVCARSR
jgi:caa(3)-type oxidase subunit IV